VYPTLVASSLLVGPQDRLHLLYVGLYPTFTGHERFDGAWSAESLPDYQLASAAVDDANALHLVECQAGIARYATDVSGAWSVEPVPTDAFAALCVIAVGAGGDVQLAYSSPRPVPPGQGGSPTASDIHLATRGPAGWSEEVLPLGSEGAALYGRLLRVLNPSAGQTVVLYDAPPPGVGDVDVRAIAKDAAGWGAPVPVGLRRFDGAGESFSSAAAPDGSRLAIAWNGTTYQGSGSPAMLAIRHDDGTWTSETLFETFADLSLGFSPVGKLWLLDGGGPVGGLLYQEP
jgi:hypothetical protein